MAEITPGMKRSTSSTVQKLNWNWCLCHVKRNVHGKLTSFTYKSWEKFKSCSNRRRDLIWMIMKDYWNEGPKGGYHRQCYQEYTDINKVSKAEQNHCNATERREEDSVGQSSGIEPPLKRVCRSQLQTFDIDQCIVCQKDKVKRAYGKGARTREPLTLNISGLVVPL